MKIKKSQLKQIIKEEIERIVEGEYGPRFSRDKGPVPGTLPSDISPGFGGYDHGGLGQAADPIIQDLIDIATSPNHNFRYGVIRRFEETFKKLEASLKRGGSAEDRQWAPDADIIGLAATLYWFTRVSQGTPAKLKAWHRDREVPSDYRGPRLRDTIFGANDLQDMGEMMNTMEEFARRYWMSANKASADLGPVAGAAGMSPAAQEWGYVLKVLKAAPDDSTAQQAFKIWGRPYLEKVVADVLAPTT